MPKVFISYRREDSAGYAHAIYNQLGQQLSKEQIFMDVDAIEPGVDFVRVLEKAVGECDVLVALIGKRWLDSQGSTGPRINNPKDFVHIEIATALERNIRVIPLLLDGMTMPSEEMLPDRLKALTRRNAIEIGTTRFNSDVERLIKAIRSVLGVTMDNKAEPRQWGKVRSTIYWTVAALHSLFSAFMMIGIYVETSNSPYNGYYWLLSILLVVSAIIALRIPIPWVRGLQPPSTLVYSALTNSLWCISQIGLSVITGEAGTIRQMGLMALIPVPFLLVGFVLCKERGTGITTVQDTRR